METILRNHIGQKSTDSSSLNNISLSQFDYKSLLKFYPGEWAILDETRQMLSKLLNLTDLKVNLASDSKPRAICYLSGKGCRSI